MKFIIVVIIILLSVWGLGKFNNSIRLYVNLSIILLAVLGKGIERSLRLQALE